jgi:hypothetical protein
MNEKLSQQYKETAGNFCVEFACAKTKKMRRRLLRPAFHTKIINMGCYFRAIEQTLNGLFLLK